MAINAFENHDLVVIIGGRDKTNNQDLPEIYEILQAPHIKQIVLLGESGHALMRTYQDPRFILTKSLEEAVKTAQATAETLGSAPIVLMSPAAASFDMFKDVYDRGNKFKNLISSLS